MTRNEFFDIFKESFSSNENRYHFDIYQTSYNDSKKFQEKVIAHFSPFFSKVGLSNKLTTELLSSFPIESRFNDDYIEENPNSQFCLFNCSINVHLLYDHFIQLKNNEYDIQLTKLYRIEQTNGQGLYSGFFGGIPVDLKSQPSPNDDPLLNFIFNSYSYEPSSYTKKWNFGFSSKEEAFSWINNLEYIKKLQQNNFFLKEIIIPSYFVIQGYQQLIFQKEFVINEQSLSLDSLIDFVEQGNKKISNKP